MDIDKVRELALLMKELDLDTVKIEEADTKLELQRRCPSPVPPQSLGAWAVAAETAAQQSVKKESDPGLITVKSPMVGVFYASSTPGERAYATVGAKIGKGDVLCIIEAMKLMNEITSEYTGEIVEVCAGNGQVVEFDQPLFRMRCDNE